MVLKQGVRYIINGSKMFITNGCIANHLLADFIGLDVLCDASNILFNEYKEKRYVPPLLLTKMVQTLKIPSL